MVELTVVRLVIWDAIVFIRIDATVTKMRGYQTRGPSRNHYATWTTGILSVILNHSYRNPQATVEDNDSFFVVGWFGRLR